MQPDQPVDLGYSRLPGEHDPEAASGPLRARGTPLSHHATGQCLRRLDIDRVVERDERLQRCIGPRPANCADLATRRVKRGHRRIGIAPSPGRVEGTAVAVLAVARLPVDAATERRAQAEIGLRGLHARPPLFSREQARRRERLVADHLRRQPHAGSTGDESVLRITGDEFGSGSGGLPVGGTRDHQPHDGLRIPPAIDQFACQPIEQLRMAWQFSLAAKLFARRDDTDAEEPFPEPVGNHAGRERIPRVHKPLCEHHPIKPSTLAHLRRRKDGRHALGHHGAQILPVAAMLQLRDSPLIAREFLEHRHGGRLLVIKLFSQALDEVADRPEFRRFNRILGGRRELSLDLGDLLFDRRTSRIDRPPGNPDDGGLVPSVRVGRVVQDRVEAKIFLLRERVVFMVVALAARDRRAHPGAHRGVHPVHDRHRAKLLVDRAPLAVGERVAVEAGGDLVVERRIRQKIAGDLAKRELVEWHIGIEGPDHPVAPSPDRPRWVVGVAGAVGIAGQIEPLPGHVLAVAVVGKQPVNEFFHRVGRGVGHESVDLVGRERQARQVEREPAGERWPIGLGLRRESLRLESRENEAVDAILRPGCILHRRQRRLRR